MVKPPTDVPRPSKGGKVWSADDEKILWSFEALLNSDEAGRYDEEERHFPEKSRKQIRDKWSDMHRHNRSVEAREVRLNVVPPDPEPTVTLADVLIGNSLFHNTTIKLKRAGLKYTRRSL